MKYRHTVVYQVRGITLDPSGGDKEVIVSPVNNVRATLTNELDKYCFEGDRKIAVANMMLTGLIGQAGTGNFDQRLADAITEHRVTRHKEFGNGPFRVFEIAQEVENFSPDFERNSMTL